MPGTEAKQPANARRTPSWETVDLLRAIALFFAFLVLLRFLWVTRSVLITAALGLLFGLALSAGVDKVRTVWEVRRGIAASLIMLLFLGVMAGLGALVAPTLRDQAIQMQRRLPEAVDAIEQWLKKSSGNVAAVINGGAQAQGAAKRPQPQATPAGAPASPPQAPPSQQQHQPVTSQPQQQQFSLRQQLGKQVGGVLGYLFPFVSGTAAALTGLVLILFIALYIATDPGLYRRGALHLFPHRMRPRANEVLLEIGSTLQRWLIARLMAMILVGGITTAILFALGIESAMLLGLIAGLLEFIPLFGPILSAVPAIGVALADSPQKALYVALAFVVIQQLEGNLITPLLLKRRVDIPPALTIIGIALMGVIFGFLGLLIAEPLIAALLVTVKMVYVEDVVGDEVISSS